jgi:hypothetical protein
MLGLQNILQKKKKKNLQNDVPSISQFEIRRNRVFFFWQIYWHG